MSMLGNPISTMNFPVDYFTGTGTTTIFTLSYVPASATSILVHIGGVKQVASTTNPAYFVNGNQLVFSGPPAANSPIEVNYLGIASQVNVPGTQTITQSMLSLPVTNTFITLVTANGAQTAFNLVAPPVSSSSLVVTANGIVQYDYSVTGSTLQLNFTPPAGTLIRAQALGLAQFNAPNDGSVTSAKMAANVNIQTLSIGSSAPISTTDVYDLDDVSYLTSGFNNVFPLNYNGSNVTVASPWNLMVAVNGAIQPAWSYKYDTTWLAVMPSAFKGYTIDLSGNLSSNGYLKFADCPPADSQIQIRTVVGTAPATPKTYPFKPLDILMGY
jgi:hypothetical protein